MVLPAQWQRTPVNAALGGDPGAHQATARRHALQPAAQAHAATRGGPLAPPKPQNPEYKNLIF